MNLHPPKRPTASRTVLITGASGVIGRALCLRFAKSGWRIGIHYYSRAEAAHETALAVKEAGAEATEYQADIRDPREVEQMTRSCAAAWGSLDVLVCNAGAAIGTLLVRTDADDWDRIIATNLTGTFHCLQAAAAGMIERRRGAIIVMGSYAGFQGSTGQTAYAASKAGLLGLVRSAAREWGEHNLRVNLVLPGWRQTAMTAPVAAAPNIRQTHLLGRAPRLSSVVATVYRLACNRDTSGQVWNVDSRIF